ncbi:MAG TPA: DNA methyltransferase [Solirubrobacterales bacterium]
MHAAHFLQPKVLYRGDNLEILKQMPSESVDLIYLDPPFFSNRNYEVIWGDEAEIRSFMDRWEGGIEHYTGWMRPRLEQMHRLLTPTGSLYLHCDWHASHYLKCLADDIFEARNFQNEIVWYYRGGGVSPRRWGRRHDTLLFYSKGGKWTFNVDPVRMEYSPESQERLKYTARAFRKTKGGEERVYDSYRPNPGGKHPDDVWSIQPLMPSNRKRLGYPTQKPPDLLKQVILASSNQGDVVLDPFCGCGTTLTVAEQNKRNWVGIDISPTAIEICEDQLELLGAEPAKVGMPESLEDLAAMSGFEFQRWALSLMRAIPSPRLSGDKGIDGKMLVTQDPIQVKQKQAGRPDVDNFETAIERAGHSRGWLVAFGFSREAREEVARVKRARGLDIVLFDARELLKAEPTERIVRETRRRGQQLSLEGFVPRAPKSRPKVDDLVASELRARAVREEV